jgi:hypothetical protein
MILIISKELDRSTDLVIDWLLYYGCKFVRINEEDNLRIYSLKVNDFGYHIQFKKGKELIDFSDIKTVWYRKDGLHFNYKIEIPYIFYNRNDITEFEENELGKLKEFIENCLADRNILGRSITNKNFTNCS